MLARPSRSTTVLMDGLLINKSVLHLPVCAMTHPRSDCILLEPRQLVEVEGRAISVAEEADAGGFLPKDVLSFSYDPLREAWGGESAPHGVQKEELPRMAL